MWGTARRGYFHALATLNVLLLFVGLIATSTVGKQDGSPEIGESGGRSREGIPTSGDPAGVAGSVPQDPGALAPEASGAAAATGARASGPGTAKGGAPKTPVASRPSSPTGAVTTTAPVAATGPVTLLTATGVDYAPAPDTTKGPKCAWGNVCQELDIWHWSDAATVKRPTVLFIHQGGWFTENRRDWAAMAERVAEAGYVTATMSYDLHQGNRYLKQPKDVENAVRWLKANAAGYGIDPARLALYGASAGGHLALLHGMRHGSTGPLGVKAIVEYSAPTDLTTLAMSANCAFSPCYRHPMLHDESEPTASTETMAGWATQGFVARASDRWNDGKQKHCLVDNSGSPDHPECPSNYATSSPVEHVAPGRPLPKMLLVHSSGDPVVPYEQLQNFTQSLTNAGYGASTFVTMNPPACHGHGDDGTEACTRQPVFWTGNNPAGESTNVRTHADKWLGRTL